MPFAPIPSTSLQYVQVDVLGIESGVLVDPTFDTVEMAFILPSDTLPEEADWNVASWTTDNTGSIPIYTALCLIGPGGALELDPGAYSVFVRVTDNPEVPVVPVPGLLSIT